MKLTDLELSVETTLDCAEGALPSFSIRAYSGGELRFPQFKHPVIVDLAGMKITEKARPALLDHDTKKRVGHTTRIVNAGTHLDIDGIVSATSDAAREVVATAKNDFPWQASIGVSLSEPVTLLEAGKTAVVNGRTVRGPAFIARKTQLREISFTALGVDDSTYSKVAASKGAFVMNEVFAKWLEAAGFNADDLTEQQLKALEASFDAEQKAAELKASLEAAKAEKPKAKEEPQAGDPVAELRASAAAEIQRQSDIRDLCASYEFPKVEIEGQKVDLAAHAITHGWSKEQTELKALRNRLSRPTPAAHINQPNPATNVRAIEAALTLNLCDGDEQFVAAQYDDRTMEAALSPSVRALASRPLSYLMHEAIRAQGVSVAPGLSGDALHAAYEEHVLRAAGPSTISLPGILSNVANKSALRSFLAVPTTWRQIAATRPVNDFKLITSYRLTSAGQFEQVGKDGEIKSGELKEANWTNKAETYGKRYHFTRQDLRNDDLSMLEQIRALLGRQAALTLEEKVYAKWMDLSDNFWSSGNGNLTTGKPLSADNLAAVEALFLDMKDDDGKPIVMGASAILVPTPLKYTADLIYKSTEFAVTTTANLKTPSTNIYAGRFAPIVSPYLSNPAMANNSASNWYMLGSDMKALQVVFLDGKQTPTIESERAEFHVLGFQFRGYFDFGVARLEERAAIRVESAG